MYEATLSAVPTINEVDCAVDGDPVYFETFLASHQPLLNVGDLQRFLACTIHLDPSLRRQMVECLQLNANSSQAKSDNGSIVGGKSSNYQVTRLVVAMMVHRFEIPLHAFFFYKNQ